MESAEVSKTIFIDTNIFLHYKMFDEIDWREVVGSARVKIVVPHVVMEELEEQKYIAERKIKKRAKKVTDKFDKISDSCNQVISDGVEIEFGNIVQEEILLKYGLNLKIQDNQILASILDYKEKNNEEAILVLADVGFKIRAKQYYKIECLLLDEKYKLKEEPDEIEKENIELRKELKKYKDVRPSLKIVFENDQNYGTFKIEKPIDISEKTITEEMEIIKNAYPKHERGINSFLIGEDEIDRYNDELDKFYNKYKVYLNKLHYYKKRQMLGLALKLIIKNNGSSPANDIDIILQVSGCIHLFDKKGFLEELKEPEPPIEPRTFMQVHANSIRNLLKSNNAILVNEKKGSTTKIRKTNGYEIEMYIDKLKHNTSKELSNLYVIFKDYNSVSSFNIEYNIKTDDLPEVEKGEIHVIIEKENGNQENLPEEIH